MPESREYTTETDGVIEYGDHVAMGMALLNLLDAGWDFTQVRPPAPVDQGGEG